MAALTNVLLIAFTCGFVCASSGGLDQVPEDEDICGNTCDKSYAAHTYENGMEPQSCKRGCRFYSIMSFFHGDNKTETMFDCKENCLEAYNSTKGNSSGEFDACVVGCQTQRDAPTKPPVESSDNDDEQALERMLYPLMYMHGMYSDMLGKMCSHMEVSWSIFRREDESGTHMMIVRSQPVIIGIMPAEADLEEMSDDTPWGLDEGTSSLVETNIQEQDNSATPFFSFFGPSQLRSARSMGQPQDLQMDVDEDSGRSDWLSCVARKTGIARIVLCFLILSTAIVMVWFCLTAAATAPEQHLSINGDLEYLRTLDEKECYYKLLQPQSRVDARPLPIKIKVEQI